MSKKKQTNTKKPIDTEFLFPPTLVGKTLKKEKTGGIIQLFVGNSEKLLQKYLENRNPDLLFQAIHHDNSILQGAGHDFIQIGRNEVLFEFVDKHAIAWESISNWQELQNWLGEKEFVKKNNVIIEYDLPNEAEKLLKKIGSALIIKRKSYRLYQTYGINHYTPTSKGVAEEINLEIEKSNILIGTWAIIKSVIRPIIKKYKNTKDDKDNLINELYNGIVNELENKLKINIPISKKDIAQFNLATVNLTIASIISHIHSEIHCEYCKKTRSKKISPNTIYKLYKTAIDPILKHMLSLPK